jgi:hypothetical protein
MENGGWMMKDEGGCGGCHHNSRGMKWRMERRRPAELCRSAL